jgi:hypothetical protein
MSADRELGVNFARRDGGRSSTWTSKRILAEAVGDLDRRIAAGIEAEEDWRRNYPRHFDALTAIEAISADAALAVARRGLNTARRCFVIAGPDGDQPLTEPGAAEFPALETVEVPGTASALEASSQTLQVPYRGELLSGAGLLRQLDDWVERGITEPTFAQAVGTVVRHPEWLDLSDQTFAILGASSAIGPYPLLMRWGARVAAVARPSARTWDRLTATARRGRGTLLVPARQSGGDLNESAGADLIAEFGAVATWLRGIEGPFTIGNYGYALGAGFVRLTMAVDEVLDRLTRERTDISLAYLATPSDAFLVPTEAVDAARHRYRSLAPANLRYRLVGLVSGGRYFKANYYADPVSDGHQSYGLASAFILEQGPNYALAKRLQRWRMIVARAAGTRTSIHVAPPSRTESVTQNAAMGQRQRLTAKIGLEAFDADTTRALAAAILVHDLRNPGSPANPQVPIAHPHEAFMFAANPGGRWRTPFDPSSSVPALATLERWSPIRLVHSATARRQPPPNRG